MNNGFLRQSTASQIVLLGHFLDDTDFKTAETALSIANTDIRLSKAGGAFVNKNSGGGTHMEGGIYSAILDATDTATVGNLMICVTVSGALPVVHKFTVIEEAIYDALFASGAARIDANVTHWLGTAAATPTVAGVPEVDVTHWLGTAAATPTVAGVPEVDVTHLAGVAQSSSGIISDVRNWDGVDVSTPVYILVDVQKVLGSTVAGGSPAGFIPADVRKINTNSPLGATAGLMPSEVIAPTVFADFTNTALRSGFVSGSPTSSSFVAGGAGLSGIDDIYVDRVILWNSGVLTDAQCYVTDYNGTSKTFTVSLLPQAPSINDTFLILP